MVNNQSLLAYPDNGLFDKIVEDLRYLHQRMRVVNETPKVYEVHEITAKPDGGRILYTVQLLLSTGQSPYHKPPRENPENVDFEIVGEPEMNDGWCGDKRPDYDSFAIHKLENPIFLLDDEEILNHETEIMTSYELSKIRNPELAGLYQAMEFVQQPQVDINGVRFVCVKGGEPSISVYRQVTREEEKIGFFNSRNDQHRYHMSFSPERELTTSISTPDGDSKLIPEVIEKEDVEFIGKLSEDLIGWAGKTLIW